MPEYNKVYIELSCLTLEELHIACFSNNSLANAKDK